MRHQQCDRSLVQQLIGDTAKQPFAHAGMAVAAHYDKVGIALLGFLDQRRSNRAFVSPDPMQCGIDAVMVEMIDGLSAEPRGQFGLFLIDDHGDGDGIGLVAIWQRLGQGSRGLTSAVPSDQHMLNRTVEFSTGWDQHEMPSGAKHDSFH